MAGITESILNVNGYDDSSDVSYSEEMRLKAIITCNFPHVTIDKIEKLNNKYLYAAFLLKKSENQNYQIKELIHSTAAVNVPSIKKKNLDWRLVQRAKYGYGVAFSENADYANYHSSYAGGDYRAFIICDVLVGAIWPTGDNKNLVPPISNYDTQRSMNNYVYVKFDDFVFYPKYALYFVKPSLATSRFHRIRNRRRW